jgi:ferritin
MNPNLLTALKDQLTLERQNAAAYDALAASLDVAHWPGSAAWMRKAAQEEREHAQKFTDYIVDRNEIPVFAALEEAITVNGDPPEHFRMALDREQTTTESIKALYYLAEADEDPQTCAFLQWFLLEQTASERAISDILKTIGRLDATGWQVWDVELK